MGQDMVRLLTAGEIECRVSTINEKGLSLLLYKDARVDQRILDETFGPFGWKRSHQSIDGNLYCTVEVYNKESGEWVAKQDVGTTGYTEKEKSQASDSFKRACFNWGIGRELYSAPFIWIPAGRAAIQAREDRNKEKRYYCNERFSVRSIRYNGDREICALAIVNGSGQTVYELEAERGSAPAGSGKTARKGQKGNVLSKEQMASLQSELERTGVAMDTVRERYGIQEPGNMGAELYGRVMSALSRTKSTEVA